MLRTAFKTSAAVAVLCTFASSAYADVNPQKVLSGLEAQLAHQGVVVTGGTATLDGGNNVAITGMKLQYNKADPINVNKILLKGVTEAPHDGFAVDAIAISPIAVNNKDVSFSFGGAVVGGYFIAGPNETNPILKSGIFRKLKTGPIAFGTPSKPIFSASSYETTISDYMASGTIDSDTKVSDIVIDCTAFPDQKVRATMSKLGYDQLKGEMTAKGSWDASTGAVTVNPMKLSFKDAADLSIEMAVDGYTPDLMLALQEMQKTAKKNEQMQGMAILGLMQQLSLRSATITVEDHTLTGRLVDYFGGLQGMNRESTIAFAKGMLPFGLAQLGNPDFAAKASAAIGQYLDNPQKLSIEAKPATPVSFASIGASAAKNPGSVIDLLNVKITANQ